MIATCQADAVRLSVRYAHASHSRHALIERAYDYAFGHINMSRTDILDMATEAIDIGQRCAGYNPYHRVLFKTKGE